MTPWWRRSLLPLPRTAPRSPSLARSLSLSRPSAPPSPSALVRFLLLLPTALRHGPHLGKEKFKQSGSFQHRSNFFFDPPTRRCGGTRVVPLSCLLTERVVWCGVVYRCCPSPSGLVHQLAKEPLFVFVFFLCKFDLTQRWLLLLRLRPTHHCWAIRPRPASGLKKHLALKLSSHSPRWPM